MANFPIFEAKTQLTKIIHVAEKGEVVQLTRHGKPAAVLIGMDEYGRLLGAVSGLTAALDRWRKEWLPSLTDVEAQASPSYLDPFSGLRSAEPGRPVEL
ncbi:MAG: type II toxin-antitoxin system Phd/YefM family antitoxin [Spirochaetaceae bacterium]|nr:type II toxin-antitoxin system Phd/YefM family antitoxin [Spirochaetaceae bacterium]